MKYVWNTSRDSSGVREAEYNKSQMNRRDILMDENDLLKLKQNSFFADFVHEIDIILMSWIATLIINII